MIRRVIQNVNSWVYSHRLEKSWNVDGSWHNVDINEIPSLAKKGTDVVFMEKRGIVEIVR